MMQHSAHQQAPSDDEDRRNRFHNLNGTENGSGSLRERAASQPPRSSDQGFLSSPSQQHFIPSSLGGSGSPWSTQRMQPVAIRSSSFSQSQGRFSSTIRERPFPSTFEDDESEGLSDTYDERYVPPSLSRGRSYDQDPSRSRSQSLATTRPGPVGSPYLGTPAMQSWNESFLSNPLNIPNSRYGEMKPPGTSRYGSLGTLGRSPINIHSSSPTGGSVVGNGYSNRQTVDISNMSPFVRDVGQILLDDGSAFRELWAGMNPPRDENGGGGSGTTSRRHSVSVVQPRRGNIVGFNAPGHEPDEPTRSGFSQSYGRGGLKLSDDDLASDLGLLNLSPHEPPTMSSQLPPSQPASLPIYAPLSRSPPSRDLVSPYHSINLTIPGKNYASRPIGSPSDSGVSPGGNSPPRSAHYEQDGHRHPELTARFIPGQGIQYLPPQNNHVNGSSGFTRNRAPSHSSTNNVSSPISPTGTRLINPQQQPFYPQQMQRRPSDAQQPSIADLGKGVPLHSVPASWPLFIVEFKAGRTDLFYLTDLAQDIRVGDLVIVEADRGKDLGKVVNDSITLAEVEAFQKQQQARIGFGEGDPTSPGGTASGSAAKKEINPKMIYGRAQQQDAQLLISKMQDEVKALQLCQSKVRAKKLPMEVVDAEYQWDRRKLTFYFIAEKRIDFRELVRELFRLYKTRIWMASLQGGVAYEQ
ncbi:PSP1 C-terminal conserved region-domain-containing protein [Infundibulicybe gibba]|nr:PSP1 C-terminal conserved region-domain-containing protein [Infundibulicybe gibba]